MEQLFNSILGLDNSQGILNQIFTNPRAGSGGLSQFISAGGNSRSPVSLNTPISYYRPTGKGVGTYSPVIPNNRMMSMMPQIRYNQNIKGLLNG